MLVLFGMVVDMGGSVQQCNLLEEHSVAFRRGHGMHAPFFFFFCGCNACTLGQDSWITRLRSQTSKTEKVSIPWRLLPVFYVPSDPNASSPKGFEYTLVVRKLVTGSC